MKDWEVIKQYISSEGYKRNSPDVNNPINIIPSGNITMENVDFPVLGIDEYGNQIMMQPEQNYQFPGNQVVEYPMKQDGGYIDGMNGMMKARIALDSEFGNPTAQRMTSKDPRSYNFMDGSERQGNVYVSSYDNLITPGIQDVDGKLQFIDEPWSKENADRSYKQSMKFETPKDAQYFGEHYKEVAPMMNRYQTGGNVMNEQMIQQLQQALQQGMQPKQLVEELTRQGIPENEAVKLVSSILQKQPLEKAQYGKITKKNYLDNLNYGDAMNFDFSKSKSADNLSDKIDYGMHSIGQGISDYYNDNTFGERVNRNALNANMLSDPRNMAWALPDQGLGSGLKAAAGLASGLAGSYLGYAKAFSKDDIRYNDPKEKPIVSSPYTPEGKDVTNIVSPAKEVPNLDWQTQYPTLTADNQNGYVEPNAKQRTVGRFHQGEPPIESYWKNGGLKQYQYGKQKFSDSPFPSYSVMPNYRQSVEEELIPNYPGNINTNTFPRDDFNTNSTPWIQQFSNTNVGPRVPNKYPFENNDPKMATIDPQNYSMYFPGATIDEGSIATDGYTPQNQAPTNRYDVQQPNNQLGSAANQSKEQTIARGDGAGFVVANNAIAGFQNFNDVLAAQDYQDQYNKMLMEAGNTLNRYNSNNPVNPYGTYTPNTAMASNYGLVANSPIQDFGTKMASAKCGGMKKKYQEGGEYEMSQEEIDEFIKNGGEVEYL